MERLIVRWLRPEDGRPAVVRVPVWVLVVPPVVLLLTAAALWAVWTAPNSPARMRSQIRILAVRNDAVAGEVKRTERRLEEVDLQLERFAKQRGEWRTLAAQPEKDAVAKDASSGIFRRLFGGDDLDVDRLLAETRRVREGYDRILDAWAQSPADAARMPTIRPVRGDFPVVEEYGPRRDPYTGLKALFQGMAFGAPSGTAVWATGAGTVSSLREMPRWGLVLSIDHGGGVRTLYAHLSKALVRPGEHVARGQLVALSGASGKVPGPRLLYGVFRSGRAHDPRQYVLPELPASRPVLDSTWFDEIPDTMRVLASMAKAGSPAPR